MSEPGPPRKRRSFGRALRRLWRKAAEWFGRLSFHSALALVGAAGLLAAVFALLVFGDRRIEVFSSIEARSQSVSFIAEDSNLAAIAFEGADVKSASDFDEARAVATCGSGLLKPARGARVRYAVTAAGDATAEIQGPDGGSAGALLIDSGPVKLDGSVYIDFRRKTPCAGDLHPVILPVWGSAEIGQEYRATEGPDARPLMLQSGSVRMFARSQPILGVFGDTTLYPVTGVDLPLGARLVETPGGEMHRWWGQVTLADGVNAFDVALTTFAPSLTLLHPGSLRDGDPIAIGVFTRLTADPNRLRLVVIFGLALAILTNLSAMLPKGYAAWNSAPLARSRRLKFLAMIAATVGWALAIGLLLITVVRAETVRVTAGREIGQGFLFGDVARGGACRLITPTHVVARDGKMGGAVIETADGRRGQASAGIDLGDDLTVMDVLFPEAGQRCLGRLAGPSDLSPLIATRPRATIEAIDEGEWISIEASLVAGSTTDAARIALRSLIPEQQLKGGMSGALVVAGSRDYLGMLQEVEDGVGIALRWDRIRAMVESANSAPVGEAAATSADGCRNLADAASGAHLAGLSGELADPSQDPATILAGGSLAFAPGQKMIELVVDLPGDEPVALHRMAIGFAAPIPAGVRLDLNVSRTDPADGAPVWQNVRNCSGTAGATIIDCPLAGFMARRAAMRVFGAEGATLSAPALLNCRR